MKVVKYTVIIPDNIVIDSAELKFKLNPQTCYQRSKPQKGKRAKFWSNKCSDNEEPNEGLLFDELY